MLVLLSTANDPGSFLFTKGLYNRIRPVVPPTAHKYLIVNDFGGPVVGDTAAEWCLENGFVLLRVNLLTKPEETKKNFNLWVMNALIQKNPSMKPMPKADCCGRCVS